MLKSLKIHERPTVNISIQTTSMLRFYCVYLRIDTVIFFWQHLWDLLDLICHWMVLVHVHMPPCQCTVGVAISLTHAMHTTHFPIYQPSTTVVRGFLSLLHLLYSQHGTEFTNRWLTRRLKTIEKN